MPARPPIASFLAVVLLLSGPTVLAQTPASPQNEPPPPPGLYTLHVYANLAQVPTLVINPDSKPFPPLTRGQVLHQP